jgi:DNA-binding MarR family transcriptional regulator
MAEESENTRGTLAVVGPALMRVVNSALGSEMNARQLALLVSIYEAEGRENLAACEVRALTGRLRIPKPALVRALDRLVELGFARRDVLGHDRRVVVARLTARGRGFATGTLAGGNPGKGPAAPQRPKGGAGAAAPCA